MENTKRHVCVTCKRKKIEAKMIQFRQHWQCLSCVYDIPTSTEHPVLDPGVPSGGKTIRVLNLYAGIGGNRTKWTNCHVTAIEHNAKIAADYKRRFPLDTVIIGDAHKYLIKNAEKFDIIWSSPTCQSHTRMNYAIPIHKKRYVDLNLYSEIIFLKSFFKGRWTVENVIPYYDPLIPPSIQLGRHLFWSNVPITDFAPPAQVKNFANMYSPADVKTLTEYLSIDYPINLYSTGKSYLQVLRNCVHPDIGLSIFNDMLRAKI